MYSPSPIARSMFWDDCIDRHYHNMTVDERKILLEWISRNEYFDPEKMINVEYSNPGMIRIINSEFIHL